MLLDVMSDEKILPTTYGELRPPLGKHRLKIVEFIAVLLKAGNQAAEEELVNSGTIKRVVDLFFEYPYNNALHHHVESIVSTCMESRNDLVIDHLFKECDLVGKILDAERSPLLSGDHNLPTKPACSKKAPKAGNLGHVTRIANKIVQIGQTKRSIETCVQVPMFTSVSGSSWNLLVYHFLRMPTEVTNLRPSIHVDATWLYI